MMGKKIAKAIAKISLLFFISAVVALSFSSEGLCREYVFLLDKSYSMNDSDPQKKAIVAIKSMLGFLKEEDKAAVYAFGTDVEELYPLSFVKSQPNFSEINYAGYTNTGEAAKRALAVLKNESDPKRNVVIITDGEIMLPSKEGTLISAQEFAAAMEGFSREKIPVYIFTLPMEKEEDYYSIYSGYAKSIPVTEETLLAKAEEFMQSEVKEPEPKPVSYTEKIKDEWETEKKLLPYVLGAIVLLVLAILSWRKLRDFTNALYSGKLIVRVDEDESKPYVYDLLRHGGERLTLHKILRDLGIFANFEGSEKLVFSPSKSGVYLLNDSNATVTRKGEILLKGETFEVLSNERIHIAFEEREVDLIYKTLKPN
ncbi:MAG: VWA domain-containing protein [Selenomonadaceae bacterium]|nr:VWA domain-containing protein [Selenomonadaceae bacterium]